MSQARRAAGFLPFSFAFAGGFEVLSALLGPLAIALALAAGIVFQLAYPGDFDYVLTDGGPALATWLAVAGGAAALAFGFLQRPPRERPGWLAASAFLLPVAIHAGWNWSPSEARRPSPLTDGLVRELRTLPAGAVVYSDPEASYRIAAPAPLYVSVAPPGHVADTEENRPRERVEAFRRFVRTGDVTGAPRSCRARWLLLDRRRFDLRPLLPVGTATRAGRSTGVP